MASTNQSPQYQKAELKFLNAKTDAERVACLEEMIRECPKHKSSEKMLANLKTRHNKLVDKIERNKRVSKSRGGKIGIKKEDMQAVIVGFANSGKSSLMSRVTNAKTEISGYEFTIGKQIIVFNKIDLLDDAEKRKIFASLQSKKYNFSMISAKTQEGIEELKEKIFQCLDKMRIYTKQPGKEKSEKPVIMGPESTAKELAEKILHGFSSKIKETKIWGPSSKFPGQKVGLNHKLKDLDIVEFKTK